MLHLACYISNGLLALLLVIQQHQHNKTNRGLIDRILEHQGLSPLPEDHPLAEAIGKLKGETLTPEQKRLIKQAQGRVRFDIPNMGMPFKDK